MDWNLQNKVEDQLRQADAEEGSVVNNFIINSNKDEYGYDIKVITISSQEEEIEVIVISNNIAEAQEIDVNDATVEVISDKDDQLIIKEENTKTEDIKEEETANNIKPQYNETKHDLSIRKRLFDYNYQTNIMEKRQYKSYMC